MINYVSVVVNDKCKVSVHKNAFIEIINSLSSTINDIKVINAKSNASININGRGIRLYLEVKIKNSINIESKISEIKLSLENHCLYLIDSKPTNIIINYSGRF